MRIWEKYCRDHGYTAIRHYDEDDGYSGTNFNRPGFQRMLADIKAGKIKRVVVKNMSRFGRNNFQVCTICWIFSRSSETLKEYKIDGLHSSSPSKAVQSHSGKCRKSHIFSGNHPYQSFFPLGWIIDLV